MVSAQAALTQFLHLLDSVDATEREDFLALVAQEVDDGAEDPATAALLEIAEELKAALPTVTAEAPGEKIFFNKQGEFADYDASNTVSVDAFLYTDDDVDALADSGKLPRNVCRACKSTDTVPLNYVSHSASIVQLRYLFQSALGDLDGKVVVDVGSRLGAVLFAGYHYSKARELVGIEFNKYFADLQTSIAQKRDMSHRVSVQCADVRNCVAAIASADVIVLNNVFQFFTLPVVQKAIWQSILTHIKVGAVLVTVPDLATQLEDAKVYLPSLADKLDEFTPSVDDLAPRWQPHRDDVAAWHLYRVVSKPLA